MRYLLVLAKLDAEKKRTYVAIATATGLELAVSERVESALAWLEGHDPRVVAFDTTVVAGEKLCQKIRSRKKLASVPLIAMVSDTSDTFVERLYGLGADDVIESESGVALIARLRALPDKDELTPADRGVAVVADKDHARCDVLGRVLMNAGYDVKFALDDVALRFYTQQGKVRLVVASVDLGSPRKFIEDARRSGNVAPWLVTAPRRDLHKHAEALEGLERVTIVASTTAPENVLFTSNELLRDGGPPARAEDRTLFGTVVGFKPVGAETDDLGFSYNISPGGIYVRTLAPPVEDRVWVELRPPRAKRRVRLEGRIAWRRPYDPAAAATAPPGFGMQILDGLGDSNPVWRTHCELYVRTTRAAPATLTSMVATPGEAPTSERTSDSKIAVVNVSARPRPKAPMFPAAERVEPSRAPPTLESHAGPLGKANELDESAIESEWEVISSLELVSEKPPPPSKPPSSRRLNPPPKPKTKPVPAVPVVAVGPSAGGFEPVPVERPIPLDKPRQESLPIELKRVISTPPPAEEAPVDDVPPPFPQAVAEPNEPEPEAAPLPLSRPPRAFEPEVVPRRSRVGLALWLLGGVLLGGSAGAAWIAANPTNAGSTPTKKEPIVTPPPAAPSIASVETIVLDAGPADVMIDVRADARDAPDAKPVGAALAAIVDAGAVEAGAKAEIPPIEEGDAGDGSELGVTLGYLVVRSSVPADVWTSGVKIGLTNRKNIAACGLRFVRIGTGDKPPSWLNQGRTVDVKCRTVTVVNQEPQKNPEPKPDPEEDDRNP